MNGTSVLDQAYIKRHNILRILSVLERTQPLSRTDLTHITEISATSVTRIVNQLKALGLVEERSLTHAPGRGRRAIDLCTLPDGLFTVGFHVGSRSIYSGLVDYSRNVRFESIDPLPDATPECIADHAARFLARLEEEVPRCLGRVHAAGISVSGTVNAERGMVIRSRSLRWEDLPLAGMLSERLGMPVYVENDVRACLTREMYTSAREDLAYLYIGRRGIGFANAAAGEILRGSTNASGEIEGILLQDGSQLSTHLQGASLTERAAAYCPDVHTATDILDAYGVGAMWAKLLVNDFRSCLEILLGHIHGFIDPGRVILGGELPEVFAPILDGLWSDRVVLGKNYEQSCALGAAGIAMRSALSDMIDSLNDEQEG